MKPMSTAEVTATYRNIFANEVARCDMFLELAYEFANEEGLTDDIRELISKWELEREIWQSGLDEFDA